MKLFAAILITFILCTINSSAQESELTGQSNGLTVSLQSSQMDIMVPMFVSDKFSLAPSFGLSHVEGFTDLAVGLVGRIYGSRGTVSPFLI